MAPNTPSARGFSGAASLPHEAPSPAALCAAAGGGDGGTSSLPAPTSAFRPRTRLPSLLALAWHWLPVTHRVSASHAHRGPHSAPRAETRTRMRPHATAGTFGQAAAVSSLPFYTIRSGLLQVACLTLGPPAPVSWAGGSSCSGRGLHREAGAGAVEGAQQEAPNGALWWAERGGSGRKLGRGR